MINLNKPIEQHPTEIEALRQRVKELEGLEPIQGKRSEDRNWQQNEFASAVLESLTHPFYVVDANDYTVQLANRATVSGKLPKNVTCYALTHHRGEPCDSVGNVCPLKEVKKTGKPVVLEHIHYDKDGNTRNVEVHGFPICDSNGNVIQIIVYCLDITQRKQAEEEVHKLLKTIETAREAINIASAGGAITYTNSAMDELFGYEKGELIGKHPHILNAGINPAGINPEVVTTKIMDAIRKKGFWEGEIYNKRKDGAEFTSYAKISALKDKDGKIVNYLSTQHDITERKRMHHDLNERIKELRCLYYISNIAEKQGITLEEIYQGMAKVLPQSWQYPDIACCSVTIGNKKFRTSNYKETAWIQSAVIKVSGSIAGKLEICYLEEMPVVYEGPFLKEERLLINEVAERLGRIIERKRFVDELHNKEKKVSQLAAAYVHAQEDERRWISLEIHDRIVQPLFTVSQQIEQLKSQMSDNPNYYEVLGDCLNLINEVGRETRNVTHDLYPSTLARYGLIRLMNDELTKLEDETGCQIRLSVQKNLKIGHDIKTTLYRVFHEALLNIRKHAGASRVVISLKRRKETIELKIEDDGVGFDMTQKEGKDPGGLESMRRRTEIIGGSFKLMSMPGAGTNLTCCVPVPSKIEKQYA